VADDVIMTSHL